MSEILIREANKEDFHSILELNDLVVEKTCPMGLLRLSELSSMACYHRVALVGDDLAAFLLAFGEGAPYASENYAWFSARFGVFVYIDRIVVKSEYSGLGIGSRLYEDLFDWAKSQEIEVATCEINLQPPNIPSQKFHKKLGFEEIGQRPTLKNIKLLSMQRCELSK